MKPNPLPVPTGSHPPPVLNTAAQLDQYLTQLLAAVEGGYGDDGYFYRTDATTAFAAVQNALPVIEDWRAQWAAGDRPASYDLIAAEALKLASTLPQAGNINQQILTDTLCEDIAEMRPTAWALVRACRAHRTSSEFLSFAKLADEIRRAEMRAACYRDLLQQDLVALARQLERDAKEQLAEARREAEQRLTLERKQAHRLKALRADWKKE